MWGGKEHNRSIMASRIMKYKPEACTEQELSLMDKLLLVTPTQENIPDILKIFNPNLQQEEEKKKQNFNNIFSNLRQAVFDQIYEQNQSLYVYRIVQNPHPNHVPEVLMKLSPQFASKYFKVRVQLLRSKVYILQTCILNLLKALQAYLKIAEEKQKNRLAKNDRSVFQSRIQERSFLESNRSYIANQSAINNSGIILQNQLTNEVRELQNKLRDEDSKHKQKILEMQNNHQIAIIALKQKITELTKEVVETKQAKDYQYGYYEGQIKRLEYELDQFKYQTESLSKQKQKYIQERETLRSTNFQIKTKLSHVEKEKDYNQSAIKAIEQNLRKLGEHYKDKQSQEEREFRETTIEQLTIARNHIASLTTVIQKKGEQIQKHKENYANSLQAEQQRMEKIIEQKKKDIEEQLKRKYEEKKELEFKGILIQFEDIYKSLTKKEKQSAEEHQRKIEDVRKENSSFSQQNQQLKKRINLLAQAQKQEQQFAQRLLELEVIVRQASAKTNSIILPSQDDNLVKLPNRSSLEIHNQLGETFGEIKTKLKNQLKRNKELQSQNDQYKKKLAISQAMQQAAEKQLKGLNQRQRLQEEKQAIRSRQKSIERQQEIIRLSKQISALKKTLETPAFTDSSILTNQYQKKNILIRFIQSFMAKTITKSELKYRYDPISLNFGYHFEKEMYPFVLLFKLSKTDKIMGVFSTSLIMSKSDEVAPRVFIFGLEGVGQKYQRAPKSKCITTARFADNILAFGNDQFTIRNNHNLHYFQLYTSIFGDQYFQIRNPEVLLGEADRVDFKVQYDQMELHRVYF